MGGYLQMLVRAAAIVAVLATSLAIAVARIAPHPRMNRVAAGARYAPINGHFFEQGQGSSRILDTETGVALALELPEGERLQWASFSEWKDEEGDQHVVGRWSQVGGTGDNTVCVGAGLARIGFPSGRVLDRVADLEAIPSAPPCWYPGAAARVVYPATDGRLYQYAFEPVGGAGGPSPDDGAVPIRWRAGAAPSSEVWINDLSWPKDPRFRGRLFASLSLVDEQRGEKTHEPARLWWLQLSRDGLTIEAAGPVAVDETDHEPELEHRFPKFCALSDGGLAVVYHARPPGDRETTVQIARLSFDPDTGSPVVRSSHSETLAQHCKAVPAVFTPDRLEVYLMQWDGPNESPVKRYSLENVLAVRNSAAAAH